MTEECTPPTSPYCLPNEEVPNYGLYKPFNCFSRNASDNNLDIHDEQYLRTEHSYLETVTKIKYGDIGFISDLFVYKSLDDLATLSPVEELFRLCRMKLMMASSWQEPQLEVRQRILNDLVKLRNCVDRAAADGSACEMEDVVSTYFNQLCSLRLFLRYLPDIPDCMLSYVRKPSTSSFPEAWYNVFHLHLDLRWYHLTCVYQLVRSRCDRARSGALLLSCRNVDEHFLEKQLVLLASELLELAIRRFEKKCCRRVLFVLKTVIHDLPHTSPYCCKCVQELWFMIQLFVETMQLSISVQPFECIVKMLLDSVQPRGQDSGATSRDTNCSEVSAPDVFRCSNPSGFRLWFLLHLSQLGGYSREGFYLGPSSSRVRSNYGLLSSVLRSCLAADSSASEEEMRVYLSLLRPLVTEWWELSTEPVMMMWEHFHCRLNSAFYVRGAPPHSLAVASPNGCALLGQVRAYLEAPPSNANSFVLFLNLLGAQLRRSVQENNRRAWQQLKGRLYSKFAPAKMANFSELGLYHFVSLFLVLALTAELKQVTGRCQELLGALLNTDLECGKRAVIWKANMAFLLLHIENGTDGFEVAQSFVSEVSLNTGNSTLMKMFVGDLQQVVAVHPNMWGSFPRHVLFDGWLVPYLSGAPPGDALPLLDLVLLVMQGGGESGASLGACVLLFVKRQFGARGADPAPQVWRAAAELTMLAAEHPRLVPDSFAEQFRYFGCSPVVGAGASLQYLCLLLQRPGVLALLESHVPGYPQLLVQSWIRFLLVCQSPGAIASLTRIIASLPEVGRLSPSLSQHADSADDTFRAFVEALAGTYEAAATEQDRVVLREKCGSYFGQVGKYVEPLLREPPSHLAVQRVYGCLHELVRNCKMLLYQKNSPSSILPSLVVQLYLPQQQQPERDVHPYRLAAIRNHLQSLLAELGSLASGADPAVARLVRQLVARYLPVLDGGTGCGQHPLLRLFTEESPRETRRLVLQAVSDEFLHSRGAVLHKDGNIVLTYILQLTKQHGADAQVLQLIVELCLRRVFEVAMFASEAGRHQSQVACNVVSALLTSPAVEDSAVLRKSFCAVLLRLCCDNLAFSMVPLFKLLSLVTIFQPCLVEQVMPQLWVEARRVESRRGVARDPALRTAMEKIEQAIKLKKGQLAGK